MSGPKNARERFTRLTAKQEAIIGVAVDMAGGEAGSMMTGWRSGLNPSQEQAVGLADAVPPPCPKT